MKTFICKQCGEKFEHKNKNAKYCSRECFYIGERVEKETGVCENCGRSFEKARKSQRFCNNKCRGESTKKNHKPEQPKICECGCGEEIEWKPFHKYHPVRFKKDHYKGGAPNVDPKKRYRGGWKTDRAKLIEIHKNREHTEEERQKRSESIKKHYKKHPEKWTCSEAQKKQISKTIKEKLDSGELIVNGWCGAIGLEEKNILDTLEKDIGMEIIRQYKVGRYSLDGYIPKWNMAVEVDESYHRQKKQQIKDREREQKIFEKIGCQFYRINI